MLSFDKLDRIKQESVRRACAYLFTPQLAKNDGFISNLKMDSVKSAFRQKAKRYHPDLHQNEPDDMIQKRRERFIKVRESYSILLSSLFADSPPIKERRTPFQERKTQAQERRHHNIGTDPSARNNGKMRKKIIAIGGAKGGIGKSLFSTNLGVFLSNRGWRTVIIDLDLGGANLHLYLGESFLKWSINDFLNKKDSSLKDVMIRSRYGPQFIGGESSQLGSANIDFQRKLKLLNGIKEIQADYIILDLGGDTSYNIIDFFLAADYGLVLTTCDPASYLDAYSFIKVALYRKLDRLFGVESKYRDQKSVELEQLIQNAIKQSKESPVKTIEELKERVRAFLPHHSSLLREVIESFKPYLIVNKVTSSIDSIQIVNRIQEVTQRNVSVDVRHLGNLSFHPEVEKSARELIPVVSKYPDSYYAKEIDYIVEKLLGI